MQKLQDVSSELKVASGQLTQAEIQLEDASYREIEAENKLTECSDLLCTERKAWSVKESTLRQESSELDAELRVCKRDLSVANSSLETQKSSLLRLQGENGRDRQALMELQGKWELAERNMKMQVRYAMLKET